jgi:hypothetical protein
VVLPDDRRRDRSASGFLPKALLNEIGRIIVKKLSHWVACALFAALSIGLNDKCIDQLTHHGLLKSIRDPDTRGTGQGPGRSICGEGSLILLGN